MWSRGTRELVPVVCGTIVCYRTFENRKFVKSKFWKPKFWKPNFFKTEVLESKCSKIESLKIETLNTDFLEIENLISRHFVEGYGDGLIHAGVGGPKTECGVGSRFVVASTRVAYHRYSKLRPSVAASLTQNWSRKTKLWKTKNRKAKRWKRI